LLNTSMGSNLAPDSKAAMRAEAKASLLGWSLRQTHQKGADSRAETQTLTQQSSTTVWRTLPLFSSSFLHVSTPLVI
jgi:hypothetical protein